MPLSLTVIILTYNEELHLERAISSIRKIASRIVVVDSGSSDDTANIALLNGAEIFVNPFITQAQQFDWALNNTNIRTEWVMRLDADEVIEPNLEIEIIDRLPNFSDQILGVKLRRKHVFLGKWIRYGGRYPVTLLRIWRQGTANVEQRWMDEHIYLNKPGLEITLHGNFSDVNLNNISYFTSKHNNYATREALDVILTKYDEKSEMNDGHRSSTRWIKENIYNKLPMWASPLLYFIYRYFILFGFLDGKAGLIYHFLQGFWYRFLVNSKIYELDLELKQASSANERRDRIKSLTGYEIRAE